MSAVTTILKNKKVVAGVSAALVALAGYISGSETVVQAFQSVASAIFGN